MIDLNFTVEGQVLSRTDETIIANFSQNYIYAVFTFIDDFVKDVEKKVIFKNSNNTAYMCILENDRCMIPAEAMSGTHFTITVVMGDRLTTNQIRVHMEHSGYSMNIHQSSSSSDFVTFIFEELDKKADKGHTHLIDDIDGLSDDLEGIHTGLDNKSDLGHTHSSSDVTDLEDTIGVDVKRALQTLKNSIRTYGNN